ncbi:MAG: hypothetical protein WCN95_14030, partial [bacterium]
LLAAYEKTGRNKAKTMKLFYPNRPANYFDRLIYDAVQRCQKALENFPLFAGSYEKECRRRKRD